MRKVVIIGSGNVAETLAKAIAASSYELVQIFARSPLRREQIARSAGCGHTGDPAQLADADIYLIAVCDNSIGPLSEELNFRKGVVAHTAGSVAMDELSNHIVNRGVFYPLQTFTAGRDISLRDIPVFVEGRNGNTLQILKELGEELTGNVTEATSEQRRKLHLTAVFASNFTNHMYAIGQRLITESGLSADFLKPLIAETAAKAIDSPSAVQVQTGPAVRNDFKTKDKHMAMLASYPELQNLYKNISLNIWETSKKI